MKKNLLKRCLALLLVVLLMLPSFVTAYAADDGSSGYKDVAAGSWYYKAVMDATEHGIMNGKGNGIFDPQGNLRRGEAAIMLYRMADSPKVTYKDVFTDVKSTDWFGTQVVWAQSTCVVNGRGDGKFVPLASILREEMVTMMYRYAQYEGRDTSASKELTAFKDGDQVRSFAKEAMKWAVAEGLILGDKKGMLRPQANITRAEAATIFVRYLNLEEPVVPSDNTSITGVTAGDVEASKGEDGKWTAVLPAGSDLPAAADVKVVAAAGATYQVEGPDTEGSYTITVTAEDGKTTAAYTLTVTVKEAPVMPEVNLNEIGLAEEIEGGTILHTWCWNFNTIKEMIPSIAAAGFSTIQTSPINAVRVGGGGRLTLNNWYYHYQPTEYLTIGNYQLGTAEEFKEMCEVAHEYGVKVIVDQVLNHMTSSRNSISEAIRNGDWGDPGLWGDPENAWTHKSSGTEWHQNDRFEETQNSLSGLIEWNTQNPKVQQYLLEWLKTCVEAGADGFRYDAAKLIELPDDVSVKHPERNVETNGFPSDFASNFWPVVLQNGASFQYGEDLQECEPDNLLAEETAWDPAFKGGYDDSTGSRLGAYQSITFETKDGETKNFNTTLSLYGWRLRHAVSTGNLSADFLTDMLVPEGASADRTVTWVESHDSYCNNASYNELDEQGVIQAWAILAARKSGTPLFYSRPMNATANNIWGDNVLGDEGSHFFMDSQVVAVNFFRNEFEGAEEYLSNPTGSDKVIMIERGNAGAVIVNQLEEDLVLDGAPVQNMADGTFTDQAYGSAFTVKDGKIYGTVKAGKVAVVYNSQVNSLDFPPELTLSVPSSEFITDTLDVTVSIRGVDHATYKLNDGEEKPIANGDVITVGEGMKVDDTVTVTVNGYDESNQLIGTVTATYTKKEYRGDTIVYLANEVVQTRGWSQVRVYAYYNNGAVTNAGWPGLAAELQTDGQWAGYWKYVLPYELESLSPVYIIFNNGSGGGNNQFDAGTINAGEQKVYTADNKWVDPSEVTRTPSVFMNPEDGTTFSSDTLEVTLYASNCASAKYQVGEGELTPYESGTTITVGADLGNKGTVTVTVYGYDAAGNQVATSAATYTKVLYKGTTTIYVDPKAIPEGWTEIAVYMYNSNGNNGSWPGVQLTEADLKNGVYEYKLPEELQYQTWTIIFNDNNHGSQVEKGWTIGPDQQKIWKPGSSSDGVWEDYTG